ncbi:MAG: PHP domain-containing protein [Chloroflexi bacterium]|nr:PHP domain-containing protein [Chloroflexota bacterium]
MLRADVHVHTCFSPDSSTSLERLAARCLRVGLGCVAITDHNTIRGALEMQQRAPFLVIVGEEVKSAQGEIIGLFLKEEVPRGLPARETVERIREQGGLVSIPHPFDALRRSVIAPVALEQVLPLADIVEAFNARNIFAGANRRAAELAQRHGLAASAVSDAHTLGELGRTYVEMSEFDGTPAGFLASLRRGALVTRASSPLVHLFSTYNKVLRRFSRRGG